MMRILLPSIVKFMFYLETWPAADYLRADSKSSFLFQQYIKDPESLGGPMVVSGPSNDFSSLMWNSYGYQRR